MESPGMSKSAGEGLLTRKLESREGIRESLGESTKEKWRAHKEKAWAGKGETKQDSERWERGKKEMETKKVKWPARDEGVEPKAETVSKGDSILN